MSYFLRNFKGAGEMLLPAWLRPEALKICLRPSQRRDGIAAHYQQPLRLLGVSDSPNEKYRNLATAIVKASSYRFKRSRNSMDVNAFTAEKEIRFTLRLLLSIIRGNPIAPDITTTLSRLNLHLNEFVAIGLGSGQMADDLAAT